MTKFKMYSQYDKSNPIRGKGPFCFKSMSESDKIDKSNSYKKKIV